MRLLSKQQAERFLSKNPTELLTQRNSIGQTCVYYECPNYGDESPVYVAIGNVIALTDFYETDDFYVGSDYEPQLVKGGTEVLCKFEVEDEQTPEPVYMNVSPSHKVEVTTDFALIKSLSYAFAHLADDGHVYTVFNREPKEGVTWKQYAYKAL